VEFKSLRLIEKASTLIASQRKEGRHLQSAVEGASLMIQKKFRKRDTVSPVSYLGNIRLYSLIELHRFFDLSLAWI
jgi:hypothetical protein